MSVSRRMAVEPLESRTLPAPLTVTLYPAPSLSPALARDLAAAVAAVNAADPAGFVLAPTADPSAADIIVRGVHDLRPLAPGVPLVPGSLLLGLTFDSLPVGGEAEIDLLRSYSGQYTGLSPRVPRGRYDEVSIIVHELGHALGLPHSRDRASVMYAFVLPGTRRGFDATDISDLDTLYPAESGYADC